MKPMGLFIRLLLVAALAASAPSSAAVRDGTATPPPEIPAASDLRAETRHGLPLLLEFHATYCTYCAQLEADFLRPMLISGDYQDKVRIRRISLDHPAAAVTDFDGGRTTVGELVRRYRITVTPTLVFLGPGGEELVHRMVGLTTPDFFGGYLDEAIDNAGQRLRAERAQAGGR